MIHLKTSLHKVLEQSSHDHAVFGDFERYCAATVNRSDVDLAHGYLLGCPAFYAGSFGLLELTKACFPFRPYQASRSLTAKLSA